MSITQEKLPDSNLIYGYTVHTSGKTQIDLTRQTRASTHGQDYSYDDVLNHAGECPPYNTFDCAHYNK